MGMMKMPRCLRLNLEPADLPGVERPGERKDFQGHPSTERDLLGLVDDPHPTPSHLADDPEIAKLSGGLNPSDRCQPASRGRDLPQGRLDEIESGQAIGQIVGDLGMSPEEGRAIKGCPRADRGQNRLPGRRKALDRRVLRCRRHRGVGSSRVLHRSTEPGEGPGPEVLDTILGPLHPTRHLGNIEFFEMPQDQTHPGNPRGEPPAHRTEAALARPGSPAHSDLSPARRARRPSRATTDRARRGAPVRGGGRGPWSPDTDGSGWQELPRRFPGARPGTRPRWSLETDRSPGEPSSRFPGSGPTCRASRGADRRAGPEPGGSDSSDIVPGGDPTHPRRRPWPVRARIPRRRSLIHRQGRGATGLDRAAKID